MYNNINAVWTFQFKMYILLNDPSQMEHIKSARY